ncbi:hypothetical protein SBRCBS47491_008055 [Sporothrix bragantina]|uniref:Uncharacterized protein n=1 Tax=Sporothrix bragantina TaxID=671064 RepID=A0ABP0CKS2_9PEZI
MYSEYAGRITVTYIDDPEEYLRQKKIWVEQEVAARLRARLKSQGAASRLRVWRARKQKQQLKDCKEVQKSSSSKVASEQVKPEVSSKPDAGKPQQASSEQVTSSLPQQGVTFSLCYRSK